MGQASKIENRPIHGGNLVWASLLANCPPDSILDFSASINPLGPPPSAIAAIQRGLERLSAYPDPNYSQLRLALAEQHNLSPEWILPGNGAAELLTWAGWDLSELESVYLLTPAFGDYWRALKTFQAKVVSCPLSVPRSPLPIATAARQGVRNAGLLLNNPHNPTGQLWTVEEIAPYLEQFALVVVDEAFMDFLRPDRQQSLISRVSCHPNLAILRSLTKFYSLPGLRLGYAIAHPDRLQRWQQRRDPWPVNVLAAEAGVAALRDTAFERQTWDWLESARSQLFNSLSALPGLEPQPGAANFLLVRSDRSSVQLQEELLRAHRILIRDCLSFPELGGSYFRVAIRTLPENERLRSGLSDILKK